LSWDQQFFDPIELPNGRELVTLRDAALYITKLPKAAHDADELQAAMQALMLVAEHDWPTMFARIGVMRRCAGIGRKRQLRRAANARKPTGLFDSTVMSAIERTTDSTRTSRHVRKVP
jgi:hypothetical protein